MSDERVGPGPDRDSVTYYTYMLNKQNETKINLLEAQQKALFSTIELVAIELNRVRHHNDELLKANNEYRDRAIKAEDALKVK